jgi:general stress protein 26
MNSINKQQPEDNFKNLEGTNAWAKAKEIAEIAKSCFFCTGIKTGLPFSVSPMSFQKFDDNGDIWFLSPKDSHKNKDISHDPFVQLLFQESPHSGFMTIYGVAEISDDKAKIDELWEPIVKTWFTEGKNDPRISVIKFSPTQGYYWDNKHGDAIAFIKMTAGAILGKTFNDSIEGKLESAEEEK